MAPHHTFQVLTKRPERMAAWFERGAAPLVDDAIKAFARAGKLGERWKQGALPELPAWPLPNVWLGTTVEDQKRADERIPHLLRTPAAVRFLSCEPLLGLVNLNHVRLNGTVIDPLRGCFQFPRGVDWVIVGGESGHGARLFDLAWARSLVEQCRAAKVPVFVKQLGARPVENAEATGNFRTGPNGKRQFEMRVDLLQLESRKGNNPDEWPPELRVREMPEVAR
jgi:protein gp37